MSNRTTHTTAQDVSTAPDVSHRGPQSLKKERLWTAIFAANTYKDLEFICNDLLGKPGIEYVSHQYSEQSGLPENISVMIVYRAFNKLH